MRTWARWTATAAMFTASFVAAGAGTIGIANAGTTSGNNSIGGGNQVSVPVSIPVNVCGNAVAVLGGAFAACEGGASVSHDTGGGSSAGTSGNGSILGGNQVRVPVNVPVNVCGNAVNALAQCVGGASVGNARADNSAAGPQTSGNESILGGNQVRVPVEIPVNVCGNAVAVLGDAFAGCAGEASTGTAVSPSSSSGTASSGTASSGTASLLAQRSYGTRATPVENVAQQSALTGAPAGLTNLPVLAGTVLAGTVLAGTVLAGTVLTGTVLAGIPAQLSRLTGGNAGPAQAATLLSASTRTAPGMGSGSTFAVAFGALLAGAASLIAAGRRSVRGAGR